MRGRLIIALAVVAPALVASPASAAPSCRIAGDWPQTTEKIGSSTWSITADGRASETGLGYASGTATLSGGVLRITWTTTNGYAGVYQWTLDARCAGTGTLTWTKKPAGETRGTTFASAVQGPAPTELDSATARRLQGDLRRLGLYAGPVDGNPSAALDNAIRSFQRRVGLAADGNCDQRCRSALAKALRLDDPKRPPGAVPRAPQTVTELQRDLKRLGFYPGPLDGRYDDAVKAAVKRFQRAHGLPVDGRCTARVQFAIVRALIRRRTAAPAG